MEILPATCGSNGNPWYVSVRENMCHLFEVIHFGDEQEAYAKAREIVRLIEIGRAAENWCKYECVEFKKYGKHAPNCPVADAGYE